MTTQYQDREVVGLDKQGCVVQWNASEEKPYSSGVNLADWGVHNLRKCEAERVGLKQWEWRRACELRKLAEALSKDPHRETSSVPYPIWLAPRPVVSSMTAAEFDAAKAVLVGLNHHSEALLAHCLWCGTPELIHKASRLLMRHERLGHKPPDLEYDCSVVSDMLKPFDAKKRGQQNAAAVKAEGAQQATANVERAFSAERIAQAAAMDDVDDACRILQDAAGITDGGVAGVYFSQFDDPYREWELAGHEGRVQMLSAYKEDELASAACEDDADAVATPAPSTGSRKPEEDKRASKPVKQPERNIVGSKWRLTLAQPTGEMLRAAKNSLSRRQTYELMIKASPQPELLSDDACLKIFANEIGFDGGLQQINADDLLRIARAVERAILCGGSDAVMENNSRPSPRK